MQPMRDMRYRDRSPPSSARTLHAVCPQPYGTVVVLLIAYILHFSPVGLQSMEPACNNYPQRGSRRTPGLHNPPKPATHHTALVRNGFTAAWVLMFLQTMKELPATLLLRPVGFDTLAIRVWLEASEDIPTGGAAALLIVFLSLPALMLLVSRTGVDTRRSAT